MVVVGGARQASVHNRQTEESLTKPGLAWQDVKVLVSYFKAKKFFFCGIASLKGSKRQTV